MIEFQLLNIWSKFRHKVMVSYYTHRVTRAVMKVAKLNILFTAAETSWTLEAGPTPHAMSHLTHLA